MKKVSFAAALTSVLAFAASLPALAVPVHATFGGTVSGSSGFATNVLNDFPVGTSASFDVTFDDGALVTYASDITTYNLAPVSGRVRLGALEWLLDAGRIWSYTYMSDPGFPVVSYGLQLTGSGPTISDSASLFGLFLRLTPALAAVDANSLSIGFAYPVPSGEFYSYANVSGTFNTSRTTSIPVPSTAILMLPALAFLLRRSRRTG